MTSKTNALFTAQPIKGKGVRYPGPAGAVDSPFCTDDGLPLGGALKEAEALLDAASEQLTGLCDSLDSSSLKGVKFIVDSAGAIVSGMLRGFQEHPLAAQPDGYHVDPREALP